jgi:predicted dehydrogenase
MKIGIVGSGMISGHHLNAATRWVGSEVVGIVDRDIERARAQAAHFSVAHTFENLADLLALKPDVVHILTPPASHAPLAIEALQAGAHVFVEKPMATSEAECEAMSAAAARAGREICVGHCLVYTPAVMQAMELITSGRVGQVVQASVSFSYDVRRNPSFGTAHWSMQLPGGLAEDLAVHPLSLLIRLLGRSARVMSVTRGAPSIPGNQTADMRALLDAERGLGTVSVSLRAKPDMELVDIQCTQALLRLNVSSMSLTVQRELPVPRKIGRALGNLDVASQLVMGTFGAAWKLARKKIDGSSGIVPLIHAFYAAIEAGKPAPVTAAEGAESVRLLRSIWPAATGRTLPAPTVIPSNRAARPGARKILIVGATGFIGSHLARTLLDRGESVRALARTAEKGAALAAAGAEIRIGDLTQPDSIVGIAEDMDVVFHLGSAIHGSADVFERVDVQGTAHVLREAERAGVKRVVYAGTLSAYPLAQKADGAVIDERCAFDETGMLGHYAHAKTRAEEAILAANKRGMTEGVIVRLGLVCGDGASVYPPHVCQKIASDRVILFGDGSVPLPLTYIDNAVDALILGATVPGIGGESFNIVDQDVLTQREYLELLRQSTGGTPRVLRLPRLAYYGIAVMAELAAKARGKEASTNRYRVRTRLKRVRWDCSKAQRVLQWRPRVPLREGLRQAFRAHAAVAAGG